MSYVKKTKRTVIQRLHNINKQSDIFVNVTLFNRIAYKLELDNSKVYIEFDKYSNNISNYLLSHRQNTKEILKNVILKVNGNIVKTNNIILLLSSFNYLPNSKCNDFVDGSYGRFQIYNDNNIVCAYNNFHGIGDLGIGSNTDGPYEDWSFSNNLDNYKVKRFTIYGIMSNM